MNDIKTLGRIEIIIIAIFALFKIIRKSTLENTSSEAIRIFLLSFPNFCEGVIGVLTLTMIGLIISKYLNIGYSAIYLLATVTAAIYVITQELKFHNLGGKNVYDPNDLVFSIIGLLVGYTIVHKLQPRINT